ncbi:MAG: Fe-Mn family superoxide dismutase [Butyrivibrio sp.]|nr:Fe-Mn family superoxide dismutase [Butyrivibrio sp.]
MIKRIVIVPVFCPDYIKAFWEVLDWKAVSDNYDKVVG